MYVMLCSTSWSYSKCVRAIMCKDNQCMFKDPNETDLKFKVELPRIKIHSSLPFTWCIKLTPSYAPKFSSEITAPLY